MTDESQENYEVNSEDNLEKEQDSAQLNSEESDEKILETARARFHRAAEFENDIRIEALEDLNFSAGNQWPEDVKRNRSVDGRPCLVVNRLPQFVRQITNDQRQNRPSIKVDPVDDNADVETAKIRQGLIRHIEYNSNADVAYDTAFDGAVRVGFGYFRIVTDYCDPMSFDQELLIKRIPNQFKVYKDPSSREPDGSDMNWCFIVDDLTKEDCKAQFPKSDLDSLEEFCSTGDGSFDWMPDGRVRIAEYFYKELKEVNLVQLSTNEIFEESELPEFLPPEITILQKRKTKIPVVKWCKMNGAEIIEKAETVFDLWIPVIPVYGEELEIDGKRILSGIIRYARDPQRMYNYWASAETEAIALAPRAPFIGVEGQFEGHEDSWATANVKNHAMLQYKPVSIAGVPAPPPQRQVYEPAVQAITMARGQAAEDLKATTGIYDAAMGNRSNENSGVAIQRRNMQSQTSNFHFVDNLTRSLRHAGRILNRAIPKVYDTARSARIIGEDGEQKIVKINQDIEEKGQVVNYAMDVGKYDVVVETGPSFATKRMEAVASMLDFIKAYPQAAQLIGDLLAKNMDWPGAQEISDRLKKALPPGIIDDKDQAPLPPEVKAQMDQAQQMIDALTKQLNAAHDERDQKTIELESKERIEMAKIQANIEIEMAKMGSKEGLALLGHEVSEIQNRLTQLNYNAPFEHEAGEQPQQEMQEQQDLGMAGSDGAALPEMPTDGQASGNQMEFQ